MEDEKIIKDMNKYKTESVGDVYSGYLIREKDYKFEKSFFFDDKMSIYLPVDFVDLPEDLKKMKYPSESRPQVIKSNDTNTVNIAFSLLPVDFTEDQVVNMRNTFKNVLQNYNPQFSFLEEDVIEKNNKKIAWFDYTAHVLDGSMYTIVACMEIDKKVFHATFNCTVEDMELWKVVFLDILQSIEVNEG